MIVFIRRKLFPPFYSSVETSRESCLSTHAHYGYETIHQGKTGPKKSCPSCKGDTTVQRFTGVTIDSRAHALGSKSWYVCENFLAETSEPGTIAAIALARIAANNITVYNGEFGARIGVFSELTGTFKWDDNVFPVKERRRFLCCSCRDTIGTCVVKTGYGGKWNASQPFCVECVWKQDRLRKALQAHAGDTVPTWGTREEIVAKFCEEAEKVWPRNFEPPAKKPDTSHHYKVGGYRFDEAFDSPEAHMARIVEERLAHLDGSKLDQMWLIGQQEPKLNPWTGEMQPVVPVPHLGIKPLTTYHPGHPSVHCTPWNDEDLFAPRVTTVEEQKS